MTSLQTFSHTPNAIGIEFSGSQIQPETETVMVVSFNRANHEHNHFEDLNTSSTLHGAEGWLNDN